MGIVSEFKWVNFFLQHHNPFDFKMPRWISINPIFMVVTRGIFAIYCIALMVMSILIGAEGTDDKKSPKWLVFATSWNYMFVTLYFIMAFGLSLSQAIMDCRGSRNNKTGESIPLQENDAGENRTSDHTDGNGNPSTLTKDTHVSLKLPFHLKIFWVLFNVTINICTLVVIAYWGLVHDYKKTIEFKFVTYLLIDRHGVNLLLMILDFTLHKIPYHFLHFIYPLIITILYIIFSIVHWVLQDDSIYEFLDWKNKTLKAVGAVIGILVFIIVLQLIWYWIHRGKEALARKTSSKRSPDVDHNGILT